MNSLNDEVYINSTEIVSKSVLPGTEGLVARPTSQTVESAAAMPNAAGDPARLRLLVCLAGGRKSLGDLAELEGEKMATVSARLRLLHIARLVSRQREAKHVFDELSDAHVFCLIRDILDHASETSS